MSGPVLRDLTDDERRAFLDAGRRVAVVATVRSDGRPHAAPVGFVTDGDDVLFLTGSSTVKPRNLGRDARVTVVVDEHDDPYRFVLIEGTAVLDHDPRVVEAIARRTWERYAGTAPPDARPVDEVSLRVRPVKVIARTHG
ncbi:MAG: TIGR03618 family F420-dependent PPOX class oxidoreductase [Actinomycetes bacterium]